MNETDLDLAPLRASDKRGLLKLQEALAAGTEESGKQDISNDTLLVKVGQKVFGFRNQDIAFVSMAKESINILGYRHLPKCVVAVASNNERLYTVIDAAQLFDLGAVVVDARARLIAFNHASLDAVMLLVSEIVGLGISEKVDIEHTLVKPEALYEMLQTVAIPATSR